MKPILPITIILGMGTFFIAQAESLIRIKCDDQYVGTKVYFNDQLAGECPFDRFIPEGKILIQAHKKVNDDYEQFFNKEVYAADGGIQKVELEMSSPQLTAEGKLRQEQQLRDAQIKEEQIAIAKEAARVKAENAKGVFIDKDTNLMWQDDIDAVTVEKDWDGAIEYCQNLTLADYDDWRLPDKDILVNLHFLKNRNSNSLENVKRGFFGSKYWSSSGNSRPELFGDAVMAVDFGIGSTGLHYYSKTGSNNVRCVRENK